MDASARAPGYDLFKSIVALILFLLSLTLIWKTTAQAPGPEAASGSPAAPRLATTPSGIPSPAAAGTAAPSATPLPSPTGTSVIEPTSTLAGAMPALTPCQAAEARSRLRAGMRALILHRLNFRSSPGIRNNWLLTNVPGTLVQTIAGPECLPHSTGAYLWWQIRLPDGRTGWSAEASLHGSFYFMEPVE